ncbi:MAG: hypothetical protein IT362_10735 [Deltaproteobacteria bacterium]|nr:hypothetical protein [Deltaproteobacteria bacterium]
MEDIWCQPKGTPLLDIRPYVPEFDAPVTEKIGWLEDRIHGLSCARDDGRFSQLEAVRKPPRIA